MQPWPYNLPQEWFLADKGPDYKPADNTIRTSVAAGPAKLRRRFTAATEDLTLTGQLDEGEIAILKDFIKLTLQEVLPFAWVDFRTGQPAKCRFKAGWSSVGTKHYAGNVWDITLALEMLP